MRYRIYNLLILIYGVIFSFQAKGIIPNPDHVVIVVMENHSYSQIVNSPAAPYINSLISDNHTALFTQSFALSHPSQPNYIQLFSGSAQGVTNDALPAVFPFTAPNLGAELLAASKSFIGYSEDLPYQGSNDEFSGGYARKHNPWVNWQGIGINGLPSYTNEVYTAFPTNYNLLPSVSFVIPNQNNDMHNGTDPTKITTGDSWLQANLDGYIQWAKTNNSLFILTFDEDDFSPTQRILTFFTGQMVQGGSYFNAINHYSILRLLEDMFGTAHAGAAATAVPIDYCWGSCGPAPSISANGPLSFCQGGSVTLTASPGNSYLWSNGQTTQSIVVNTSGNYSVAVVDFIGCSSSSASINVNVSGILSQGTVFRETMGTVTGTTAISTHAANSGFDNDAFTFSGNGDVRSTAASSGYTGASGAANIFITNTVGTTFSIAGINSSGLSNLSLSFGLIKSTIASTGSDFLVRVSSDGINYTSLTLPPLPTGSGTAVWRNVTVSGNIPATANLRIQFVQNGAVTQYRIDDVTLSYSSSLPVISANGPTVFCQGGSVVLSSTFANSYSWSNGATTQNITVTSNGNYYVYQTGGGGCIAPSNVITVSVNNTPSITSFSPVAATEGESVSIFGSGLSGTSSVTFNGMQAGSYIIVNDGQINAIIPTGATSGVISVLNSCGSASSSSSFTVVPPQITLNLKLFIEGYFLGGGQMKSVLGSGNCDTVTVELHKDVVPYNKLYSVKGIINTSGNGTFTFPGAIFNTSFYIVVYNHNTIDTWSSSPVLFQVITSYDFSLNATQAYGNNQKDLGNGSYALFSGDVTRDGQIDILDMTEIINSLQSFQSGYSKKDLTGDGLIESSDFSLIENHSFPIYAARP